MNKAIIALIIIFGQTVWAETDASTEPSPCEAKMENQWIATRTACQKKSSRSLKSWKTKEEALEFIKANMLSNPQALVPFFGCDISDLTQYEFICEYMTPKVDKEALLKFTAVLSKFQNVFEETVWIQRKTDNSYYYLCSKNIKYMAITNDCIKGKSLPLIEIVKHDNRFYISGVPVTWNSIVK